MTFLILGFMIWSLVHLFPAVMPAARTSLIGKIGNGPYQGLFALSILLGIGLIVFGWRNMVPTHVYAPPADLRHLAMLLVAVGFILIVAANFKATRIKRFIRHPQLTGVLIWALAHLLANGDSRSVLMFSVLAAWCVVSILAINRRDGAWEKPQAVMPVYKEALIVVIGLVLVAIVTRFHVYLAGVPIIAA